MVTVGLWRKADIDKIEAGQYRKILGCSNLISNKVILNTMTHIRLAGDAIMHLTKNVFEQYKKQNRITNFFDKRDKSVSAEDCKCSCHNGEGQPEPYPRQCRVGVPRNQWNNCKLKCCQPRDSIMKGQRTQQPR